METDVETELEATGDPPHTWVVAGGPEELARALCDVPGRSRGSLADARSLQGLEEGGDVGVVLLEVEGAGDAAADALAPLAAACQRLASLHRMARVVLVTRLGARIEPGDQDVAPASCALLGLSRVVRQEAPGLQLSVVDIDDPASPCTVRALDNELSVAHGPPLVAIRHGRRYLPRRTPWRGQRAARAPWDGSVLITGGLGALGLAVAAWAADRGAAELVLVGRGPPGEAARAALGALRARGVAVVQACADVTDPGAMGAAIAAARTRARLAAVVHAAGVDDAFPVSGWDPQRALRVLGPKVAGAMNLHRLTRDIPLDAFVLFSSLGGWLGLPGQGAYAAANAFLDGLALRRRAEGLPALSIGWCGWRGAGMAATAGGRQALAHLAARGVGSLEPAEAIAVLDRALAPSAPPCLAVMPHETETARAKTPGAARDPAGRLSLDQATPALRRILEAASPARRLALLSEQVLDTLEAVLRLDPGAIHPTRPLRDLGLDSLMAVDLAERLNRRLGLDLPGVVTWQHPTVDALSRHMAAALEPGAPENARGQAPVDKDEASLSQALAGLSEAEIAKLLREV